MDKSTRYYQSLDNLVDELTSILKRFNALPNAWFAGIVALALGQIERHFLIVSRIGYRFNALFRDGSAAEYRKKLFGISLLLAGIWQ